MDSKILWPQTKQVKPLGGHCGCDDAGKSWFIRYSGKDGDRNTNYQQEQLPSVNAGGSVVEQCVCVHCTYLISPFFKITKANVGINLASEYLNGARGMSAVFRPAWCIHCSRFTVGTDRKRETIIHVSIINGQIKAINPNQVKCLYISTLFSRQWD